jgi:putative DNA primase/helicase
MSAELTPEERVRVETYRANLTDAGNAEVFRAQYGDLVRYDHARQRWLVWNRHRWQPDTDATVYRMALQSVRSRLAFVQDTSLDGEERRRIASWALRSESRSRLDATLALARTMLPIADSGRGWDDKPGIVGSPNGVVELRTGTLRDGRPSDRITKNVGMDYLPEAQCERWERFLVQVFDGDRDLIAYVQKLVGYSLTAEATLDLVLFLMGIGRNGKSTFLNTITSIFADYAHDLPAIALLEERHSSHTTEVADLESTRFVTAIEVTDHKLNSGRLKQLSGGDGITARKMRQDNISFPQTWQLWLSTNHQPRLDDSSLAAWERVKVIPFRRQFLLDSEATDPDLEAKLRAEGEGILRWAVHGAIAFYAEGLGETPSVVIEATDEYREDVDPLTPMIERGYLVEDPDAWSSTQELYDLAYRAYAEETQTPDAFRFGITGFAKVLAGRFQQKKETTGKRRRGVLGVRVREQANPAWPPVPESPDSPSEQG